MIETETIGDEPEMLGSHTTRVRYSELAWLSQYGKVVLLGEADKMPSIGRLLRCKIEDLIKEIDYSSLDSIGEAATRLITELSGRRSLVRRIDKAQETSVTADNQYSRTLIAMTKGFARKVLDICEPQLAETDLYDIWAKFNTTPDTVTAAIFQFFGTKKLCEKVSVAEIVKGCKDLFGFEISGNDISVILTHFIKRGYSPEFKLCVDRGKRQRDNPNFYYIQRGNTPDIDPEKVKLEKWMADLFVYKKQQGKIYKLTRTIADFGPNKEIPVEVLLSALGFQSPEEQTPKNMATHVLRPLGDLSRGIDTRTSAFFVEKILVKRDCGGTKITAVKLVENS